MTKSMKKLMINLFAEVLPLLDTPEERMQKLEEFDRVCGASIPDWEERMKEKIAETGHKNALAAIAAVDAFHAKCHVYDKSGNLIYDRIRYGNDYQQITITYNASAPKGQKISISAEPDYETMTLDQLRKYHEELQSALDDLEGEEPDDEDSDEYEDWENQYDQLEDLIEEVDERLEELGDKE